jgi:hypothetical protein
MLLFVAVVLGTRVAPVEADAGTRGGGGGSSDPTIGVYLPGAPGGGTGGGGGGIVKCIYFDAGQTSGGTSQATDPVPGQRYQIVCFDASGATVYSAFIIYELATPVIAPATLARQAWKQLPLVFPPPATSPAIDQPQYVNLATWLWVEPGAWVSRSATAEVPGLSATVTATPMRVEWDLGDGSTVTCGAGTPYDTARPAAEQSTDCSHQFRDASSTQPDGRFHAVATMWWSVWWTATDGSMGVLPAAFRSTRFTLEVDEIQALRQEGGT